MTVSDAIRIDAAPRRSRGACPNAVWKRNNMHPKYHSAYHSAHGAAFFLSLLMLGASPAALARQAAHLPDIDVDSDAMPDDKGLTARRLSRSQLRAAAPTSSDTARVLQSVPGVGIYGAGGFSSLPVIRGLGDQRLGITVDGISIAMACPNDMNPPLSYTDPQTINSIDVITGVSPVRMGGDSIGGVIAVETATPRFAKSGETLFTAEASTFYRSNGDGFGGALSATVASEKLSLGYNGSYTRSENIRGGNRLGTIHSSEYKKTDHGLNLAAQTEIGLFELKGGYHFSPYEGFPNQPMDMTSNKSWYINGHYAGVFGWGDIDLRAYYRDTAHEMNFLADKGGTAGGGMPMNTDVHQAGYAIRADIMLGNAGILRLGNAFNHEWMKDIWPPVAGSMMMGPDAFININGAKRDRIGTFLEWEKKWAGGFSLVAGIRNDQVWMNTGTVSPYGTGMMQMADGMAAAAFNAASRKRHDSNWGGSAIARAALSPMVDAELGYARKVRSPNIYERYSWGRGSMSSSMIGWFGDGNAYVGAIALAPEKADTISGALHFHDAEKKHWSITIAPHYTRVQDYIDAVRLGHLSTGAVQLQFANQDAELYGADFSGNALLWSGTGAGTAHITAKASWLRGQNLTDNGPLYHQMPFNASLGLHHEIGGLETRLDISHVTRKDRVDATRNEPETSAYTLVNLSLAYSWKQFRISIGADNLFNEAYYAPLGGMSLGDRAATGTARPVPGAGRSVNFGLSWRI